jgi:hypothetical protein
MVEGWNRQRSYGLESARIIAYSIAATNRDPKKSFPKMQEFMPLPTDEVQTQEEKEAELMDTYNRIREKYKKSFPKTFTA